MVVSRAPAGCEGYDYTLGRNSIAQRPSAWAGSSIRHWIPRVKPGSVAENQVPAAPPAHPPLNITHNPLLL